VADVVTGEPWLSPRALALLVAASLLLSQTAGSLYAELGRAVPDGVAALGNLLIALSVIAWFRAYTRAHSIAWVFDMGTFLLVLWFLLVPYYLVRREGWRGLGRVGVFVLAYAAAVLSGGVAARIGIALLRAETGP